MYNFLIIRNFISLIFFYYIKRKRLKKNLGICKNDLLQ